MVTNTLHCPVPIRITGVVKTRKAAGITVLCAGSFGQTLVIVLTILDATFDGVQIPSREAEAWVRESPAHGVEFIAIPLLPQQTTKQLMRRDFEKPYGRQVVPNTDQLWHRGHVVIRAGATRTEATRTSRLIKTDSTMALTSQRPAWQTDELDEEWIEPDDLDAPNDSTCSISLTAPLGNSMVARGDSGEAGGNNEQEEAMRESGGTFLIREDVPTAPLLPKTPGHNKNVIKDFFTPLPLEKMFEPPSPPSINSASASQSDAMGSVDPSQHDEVGASGSDTDSSEHQDAMAENAYHPMQCRFTFSVPRSHVLASNTPQAQSTPGLLRFARRGLLPATDPRLRLFQLQYDTFTRDHLSQLVDSIAVNTPSGSSGGEPSPAVNDAFACMATQLSRVSETSSPSRLRSIKRIKLSPTSDYGDDEGHRAIIRRPILRRDYVSESKSLMQQIKQARDFSTISTRLEATSPLTRAIEAQRDGVVAESSPQQGIPSVTPALLEVPKNDTDEKSSSQGSTNSKRGVYSSLSYRRQAADLMELIRNDMKGQGRIFSGDTMVSHVAGTESQSTARQSASTSQRTASVYGRTYNKENTAESTEHIQIWSPTRREKLSSSTSGTRSLKKASPRKLRRVGSDKSLHAKTPFEVPAVTVFTAWTESDCAKPVSAFMAMPSAQSSPKEPPLPPVSAGLLAPPTEQLGGYLSASLRARAGEDLNRFVSSSTASGTTLTAGSSIGSCSKHPGPAQMTRIGPGDIPPLPDRVGKMVYDKELMKWVKDTAKATGVHADDSHPRSETDGTSEDPFRDIESFKDDDTTMSRHSRRLSGQSHKGSEMSRITEVEESESEDEEEKELTSFSIGDPPSRVVQVMTGDTDSEDEDEDFDEQAVESEEDSEAEVSELVEMSASMSIDDVGPGSGLLPQATAPSPKRHASPAKFRISPRGRKSTPQVFSTPLPSSLRSTSLAPTPLRSAMKSSSITPNKTPTFSSGHRRSVSFSDGKREGQIRDLHKNTRTLSAPEGDASKRISPRTWRISNMMEQLEGSSYEEESPSKAASSARPPADEIQPFALQSAAPNAKASVSKANSDRRNLSRSPSVRSPKSLSKSVKDNATFLTECSFGVAHDRLVQVITDVQPFEPYWEELSVIDLSRKNLDSVARLKEFLPRLDSLCLDANQVSYLSGIPSTVRSLSVASNVLTSIASFSHLLNLENLDISGNDLDSLRQLECLRHLRELRADGNKVTSVDGLEKLDGLVKLSLVGNAIHDVDLEGCRWTRLEMLNLRGNRIETIRGLACLPSLQLLNLEKNRLGELDPRGPMPRLRILRASGNRLQELRAASFPNVRTLYLDDNYLGGLVKGGRLTKLENLSLRNQRGRLLNVSLRDVRDVKRLYLSGNALKAGFLDEACYNLTYLELAGCRLATLPGNMAKLVPNLRVLNLNYNFLEDVRPLQGLTRLKKLTVIGSRLKGTKEVLRVVRGMGEAEVVDFRMNPCTLSWYVPLLDKAVGRRWAEWDGEFRRGLPTAVYSARMAYRGHVMRACAGLRELDGVEVTAKEREKAAMFLAAAGKDRGYR
ncbi:hypothetical protein NEOLEDRAFT_1172770 [Neolentinus lepideus HHB14362 ss-1]|uniref:L domain-like protein n=1 Tax=Neolentinus lepideus HHB14362 ss-1 TaxID=1314782 RepID=A0A165NRT5_9AGAM|nr:hypothetical protein NEOLEDRAFT_1172770 [Neolentinus lepideus HHB14362 ss-1]